MRTSPAADPHHSGALARGFGPCSPGTGAAQPQCQLPHQPQSQSQSAGPWILWQLADSAFPLGGFAHAGGLEAAWQLGEVSAGTLRDFIHASLVQTGRGAVPFAAAAHAEPECFERLDGLCDAFLTSHVANRASRVQGRSLLLACERAFAPGLAARLLGVGKRDFHGTPGHAAPALGAVGRVLGLDLESSARLLVFQQLRGLVAAAIRLNIVGPLEAQAVQHQLGPAAECAARTGLSLGVDDVAQTAPVLELLQAHQDRLYSRLFQS